MTATTASRSSPRSPASGTRALASGSRFARRRSAARMMRKRTLRVLMLMDRDLVPPDDADNVSKADLQTAPWKMEYDVSATLHNLKHEVRPRSEEHTSELQSPCNLVCRLLLEKKKSII